MHENNFENFSKSIFQSSSVSELEVENEKLRSDYDLLRSSIHHGSEMNELEGKLFFRYRLILQSFE